MSESLEVRTSHREVSDVVRELAPFADDMSLRLPSGRRIADGEWVRFSVHLLDGSPVLEGVGRCQGSTQEGASTYRVRLSLLSFDARNEVMYERMLLAGDADDDDPTGTVDVRAIGEKILRQPPTPPRSGPPPLPRSRPRPSSRPPPSFRRSSTLPPPASHLPPPPSHPSEPASRRATPAPPATPPARPSATPPPPRERVEAERKKEKKKARASEDIDERREPSAASPPPARPAPAPPTPTPPAPAPPTDDRTSPAIALPEAMTTDTAINARADITPRNPQRGLRLDVPARLVERARALAPTLPAEFIKPVPTRETVEEAVLRAALRLGLASLAALCDVDDES